MKNILYHPTHTYQSHVTFLTEKNSLVFHKRNPTNATWKIEEHITRILTRGRNRVAHSEPHRNFIGTVNFSVDSKT